MKDEPGPLQRVHKQEARLDRQTEQLTVRQWSTSGSYPTVDNIGRVRLIDSDHRTQRVQAREVLAEKKQ